MRTGTVIFILALLVEVSADAGTISSLSFSDRLDGRCNDSLAVAGPGESVPVVIDGKWFESGECRLYVDGELVDVSTGSVKTNFLEGASGSLKVYKLTLVSGGREKSGYLTVFPSDGHSCTLHSVSGDAGAFDSCAEGTVRRMKAYAARDIAWSTLWNDGSDRSVVKVYSGSGTAGDPLCVLVDENTAGEGTYSFLPESFSLGAGVYTLTHFDGVETLTANVKLTDRGTCVILK